MIEQRFCFRSGPSVHRCHGELRLRNVSNRKPNHPIPAFVTKFSSFGCFLAKGDFHRRKSSLPRRPRSVRRSSPFVRFVGFSPLRLSGGRGKRDFPVSFCSFFFLIMRRLGVWTPISQLLLLLLQQRRQKHKRALWPFKL